MLFAKVIKYEGDNKTFVWKYPTEDFNTGSQLIVHESQEAIFIQNGQVMDTFGAGKHTLTTENLPIISSLMSIPMGGKNPFHCELYFINKTEQMAIPWGTNTKIQYLDPVYKFPISIGASGMMNLSVDNSGELLLKIVGTDKILTQEQLTDKMRAFVLKHVKSALPENIIQNGYSVFELDQHIADFSELIRELLGDEFIDYGIKLAKFTIMNIQMPEDDLEYVRFRRLHYKQVTDVAEAELKRKIDLINSQTKAQERIIQSEAETRKRLMEGYTYQEEKAFDVATEVAKNDAVAQMGNIGIGVGMMSGIGTTLGNTVGSMTNVALKGAIDSGTNNLEQDREIARFCSQCGNRVSAKAVFCEKCGNRLANDKCIYCGAELSSEARFCSVCGKERG